jgi:site-specific DNA-adenine methylase
MHGLPYKGSKRRYAKMIVETILAENQGIKYFIDAFGGGGAISMEFARQSNDDSLVFYNDLNKGVVKLFDKILDESDNSCFYQWVDREEFHLKKKSEDWWGGFLATVWSFASNQADYIYGKNRVIDQRAKFKQLLKDPTLKKSFGRVDVWERINLLIKMREYVKPFKEKIISSSKSWDDFVLTEFTPVDETIIYLDPPYRGKRGYQKGVDYEKLYSWIRKTNYKVYMSEYNNELGLREVMRFKGRNGIVTNNNFKPIELVLANF